MNKRDYRFRVGDLVLNRNRDPNCISKVVDIGGYTDGDYVFHKAYVLEDLCDKWTNTIRECYVSKLNDGFRICRRCVYTHESSLEALAGLIEEEMEE